MEQTDTNRKIARTRREIESISFFKGVCKLLQEKGFAVEKEPSSHPLCTKMSAKPREITVSFFVNALKDIDAINGTVELDFILYCSWIDPDLKGISVEDRPPYDEDTRKGGDERECCWNPKIEVNNNVSLETLWSLYPPGYQGVEEGKVIWGARYRGCISNDMDLSMFPLDSDSISISIGPKVRFE